MQHDALDGDTQHLLCLGVYTNKFHFRGLHNNGADNHRHFFDAEIASEYSASLETRPALSPSERLPSLQRNTSNVLATLPTL